MTFMLASVVDPREAETAVRYGADIVDVKDVRTAFGSVGPSLVRTIVDAGRPRLPMLGSLMSKWASIPTPCALSALLHFARSLPAVG
jgi:uncharacterized protein (UPF0264 family)